MVIRSGVQIQIVEVKSLQAYKEHVAQDGKVYAEVEPDTEYYLQYKRLGPLDDAAAGPEKLFLTYEVDGQDLGCHSTPSVGKEHKVGFWSRDDSTGEYVEYALKFTKPSLPADDDGDALTSCATGNCLFGKIQVSVYEGVPYACDSDKEAKTTDKKNTNTSQAEPSKFSPKETVGSPHGCIFANKMVVSVQGSTQEVRISSTPKAGKPQKVRYQKGKLIDTITLHYCTTVGLMAVGVLAKPADPFQWEGMKQQSAAKRSNAVVSPDNDAKKIRVPTPEKIRVLTESQGGKIMADRHLFLFDLTKEEDEDV